MPGRKKGISACIITLNEEKNLARCLESLSFVDEIIIVDCGSTDQTKFIARKYLAKVFYKKFEGFAPQKNYAISRSSYRWILTIDADEVVTTDLKNEIIHTIRQEQYKCAYIGRISRYMNRWILHGGWYPDFKIRLFQNGCAHFLGGSVHEYVACKGQSVTLKSNMLHYGNENTTEHLMKIDHYSTLFAEQQFLKGRKSSVLYSAGEAAMKFFIMYFFKRGFLDGKAGFVLAVMGAYYNFLKYIKILELQQGQRKISQIKDRSMQRFTNDP